MFIDLQKCVARPLEIRQSFDLTGRFASYPDIETIDPVALAASVTAVGGGRFLVTGTVATRLSAYCVRCLEPFPVDLSAPFQLTYLPQEAQSRTMPGDHEMDPGEVGLCYYQDDRIELLPLLEELLNLAMPMRFLCKEDCPGLCPGCGANKNLTDCGCSEPTRLDSRLENIKGLHN